MTFDGERFAPILVPLGIAATVFAILRADPLSIALIAIGVILLALACWSARDGFLLFGLYPRVELRRALRRQRIHLWRGIGIGVIGLTLIVGYAVVAFGNYPRQNVAFTSTIVVLAIAWHLFILVFSVTLTLMAYSVAEDRDSQRLDFALASDLRGREIVFGKFLGRFAISLAYVAGLLPIIILLPILFGVDPDVLILITVLGLVTLFSISALAVYSSVLAANKKSGGTVMTAFLVPYFLLGFGLYSLRNYPEIWFFPGSPLQPARYDVSDLSDFVNAGNPILLIQAISQSVAGASLLAAIADQSRQYTAFHVGVGLLALAFAARKLRPHSARLTERTSTTGKDSEIVPPVSDRPVLWKERYFTPAVILARRNRKVRILSWLLIVPPCLLFLAAGVSDLFGYKPAVTGLARIGPVILVWIFSVASSRFGLETIVRERDKGTLTSLLCTDLSPREIFRDKFIGIIRIMLPVWFSIAAVAACAVVAGGMTVWTALAATVMVVILGLFFTLLGLHTSATATSLEASSKSFGWKMAPCAILPPLALIAVAISPLLPPDEQLIAGLVVAAILLIYATASWFLWKSARARFDRACDPASESGPILAPATPAA